MTYYRVKEPVWVTQHNWGRNNSNSSQLKILLTRNINYIQEKRNSNAAIYSKSCVFKKTHGLMMFYLPCIQK
jgi:hypothetical protein